MATDTETLFNVFSSLFSEDEKTGALYTLKGKFPEKTALFDEKGLSGGLKELETSGAIDPNDGATKLLEMLAEKTSKEPEVSKLVKEYVSPITVAKAKKIVGRDKDMDRVLKFLSDIHVPGVNLFGESGVGKTTLANEVSKKLMERVTFTIDLRSTKDIKNVYFKVLKAFGLAPWDYSKERIYNHLQKLTTKTFLCLDNVEQFFSEDDLATRKEFLEFLNAIIVSEACKTGQLKVFLTSRTQINEQTLKRALFVEYKLEPFSKKVSGDFISRRVKDDVSDDEQHRASLIITDLCRDTAYLLQGAEQLKREYYSSSVQVLKKITAQIEKGIPKQFACISALFDTLPSDHLKEVAVTISVLCCPFSVSIAMAIAEISTDYDARWDLQLLVNYRIITAEDVDGKRKYDLHALFREFVTYLCDEHFHFKQQFERGKKQFTEHFSKELNTLANNLEKDFVVTFSELEDNRPNLEHVIDIVLENETFELLLHSEDLKKAGLVSTFFKYLLNNDKRKKLFETWSKSSKKQGNLLTSAYIKCWEALLVADMQGTESGYKTLNDAKRLLDNAGSTTPESDQLLTVKGMYLFCKGNINYQSSWKTTEKSAEAKTKMERLLHEALCDLEASLAIHRKVYGDHTLTARSLDLMGNCYMSLYEPEKAESLYRGAMEMKQMLAGSEKHDDIVHYYNQLSQMHQMMGDKNMEGAYGLKKLLGPLLPYQNRAKDQYNKAADFLIEGLKIQKELGVCDTEDTATFQRNLANIYIVLKKYDKALEYAKKSSETRYNLLGKHPETVRILYLIGIIHEWRNDHKAALQSYEEAFIMEESLPADNHSVVRKLLCDRLEKMCQKLFKRRKLKEYGPRIKVIRQIKDLPSSSHYTETEAHTVAAEKERADDPETADEAVEEEDVPGFSVQSPLPGDPLPPEETPVTHTDPGTAEMGDPVQIALPTVPSPPEDTSVTHTHPGTAETGDPVQIAMATAPSPPEDTPVVHTQPLPAEMGHPIQSDFSTFPLPPADDTTVTDTEPGSTETKILIDESGGPYDVSRKGIFLEVPPNALTERTEITCTVQPNNYSPSPAGDDETLVSNIVELGPYDVDICQPITVNLMHSGPGRDLGYETVVKAFNRDKRVWEEIEELQNKRKNVLQEHYDCDYVQVQVAEMTTLAVVTRLVTDRFEITPRGGVVKSSVCRDVTIDFPEGAVDKKIGFTIKLLLMPEDILEDIEAYPFPILSIDGFNGVDLLKPATLQLPKPYLAKPLPGQICLFRQRETATGKSEDQWMDITDEVHAYSDEPDPLVYLKVKRFSRLSAWIQRHSNDDRSSLIERLSSAFKFARRTPRSVCFAAFKKDVDDYSNRTLTIKLLCADNKEVSDVTNQEFKGFQSLKCISADKRMRPEQKAYINVEGQFQLEDDDVNVLRFQEDQRFMKDIDVVDQEKEDDDFEIKARGKSIGLIIGFYEKPTKRRRLCRLSINKKDLYKKMTTKRDENKAHELCAPDASEEFGLLSSTKMNLSDYQKRWLVVGICLNKTLLPTLRDFMKLGMDKHYTDLKTTNRIDDQSHALHFVEDGGCYFNYGNINNNKTNNNVIYDYNVQSAVDLAKLYLQPFLANFTDFDDSCDMSVVLGILSSASVFSLDVIDSAKKVRQDVRNVWAHCNFKDWDKTKFTSCFQLMELLLRALNLPPQEKAIAELRDWQTKGVDLCMGQNIDAEALEFCEAELHRLSQEIKRLDTSQKQEAEQIANALTIMQIAFERNKEDIYKRLEALEQQGESRVNTMEVMEQKVDCHDKKIEALEQNVQDISLSNVSLKEPVECFGILITEPKLRDLPEDIVPLTMKCFEDTDTPEKCLKQWRDGGREEYLRHISRTNQCQHLLDVLQKQFSSSSPHLIELISTGKRLVNTPLKEDYELKENVIEIVSNSNNCSWANLAVDDDIVKKNKEELSKDEQELSSQMLRQWIETSDESRTLENIFSILRSCGDKETGAALARYTTDKCKE